MEKCDSQITYFATAQKIISALKYEFDSHDFLMTFILIDTLSYLGLLKRCGSVEIAHQQIGQFLSNHSTKLKIEKVGDIDSENIFGKINKCALWRKQ